MFVKRRPVVRLGGFEVGLLLTVRQRSPFEPRNRFVEHCAVLGGAQIVNHCMRQPQAVVGDPGANAAAARGMPPVLNIAFAELPRGGPQQMRADKIGPCHCERQHVLELVTESVRTSALVERGAAPDATRERLIQQPAVEQQVHRRVRRCHLHCAQYPVPQFLDFAQRRTNVDCTVAFDERSGIVSVGTFAEQEQHLGTFSRIELHRRLQGGTGIQPRAGAPRQYLPALKRRGVIEARVAAQELEPVAGPRRLAPAQIGKRNTIREIRVPGVSCKQGAGCGVELGDHMWRRNASRNSQHPLRIGCDGKSPRSVRKIFENQARDLYRVAHRHELKQIQCDAIRRVLEPAVPLAVADDISRVFFADRNNGWPPNVAVVIIPDIEGLTRRVADGIVRPWCELVLAAVHRPAVARTGLGDLKAELRICHHVHPGRRSPLPLAQDRDVLAATL